MAFFLSSERSLARFSVSRDESLILLFACRIDPFEYYARPQPTTSDPLSRSLFVFAALIANRLTISSCAPCNWPPMMLRESWLLVKDVSLTGKKIIIFCNVYNNPIAYNNCVVFMVKFQYLKVCCIVFICG
jgi:hypothetical protein